MDDRRRKRVAVAVLALAVALRVVLLIVPGYPPDLRAYECWALRAGTEGVAHIYDYKGPSATTGGEYGYYDYPPLYAYVLAPAGAIDAHFRPEDVSPGFHGDVRARGRGEGPAASRGPRTCRHCSSGVSTASRWATRSPWIVATLYLAQPAVFVDSGRWGQPDAIHTFLVLLALAFVLSGRAAVRMDRDDARVPHEAARAAVRPAPCARDAGAGDLRATVSSGMAVIGTVLVVFLPFLLDDHFRSIVRRIVADTDIVPYTTLNAHNLWWLVARWQPSDGPSWVPSRRRSWAPLVGIAYALTARVVWTRRERDDVWFEGLFVVALVFFFVSTHLHENHLFAAIPFALLCARGRVRTLLAAGVGVVAFTNLMLHDPWGDALVDHLGLVSVTHVGDQPWPLHTAAATIGCWNALLCGALCVAALSKLRRDDR